MKKILFIAFAGLCSLSGWGQSVTFFPNTGEAKILKTNGDTLRNAWAGGLDNPTFSKIDLNFDGNQDLFVFDHWDSTIATYIYIGKDINNKPLYRYDPRYASFFPSLTTWAALVDYNRDGLPDIFAFSHERGGIEIYKNVSSGGELKFQLERSELEAHPNACQNPAQVYSDPSNMPSFVDIDGDGDIDIIALDVFSANPICYKNKYGSLAGKFDSLYYEENDEMWGSVQANGGTSSSADSGVYSPIIGKFSGTHCDKQKHSGGNFMFFDGDNDGDMDVLYSDINGSGLCYLKNGRKEYSHHWDTIVSTNSKYINTVCPYWPASFYLDMDNDGVRDLLVSPMQQAPGVSDESVNNVLYYHNNGYDKAPNFSFRQNNFLQEDEVDFGEGASPAFLDRNGDGNPEYLVIGTHGNIGEPIKNIDRLLLFKNLNTALGKPVFKKIDDNWLSASNLNEHNLMPTFGDLDGDGKMDMLIGKVDGKLYYYHNTGTGSKDSFTREKNPFIEDSIDVGNYSAPAIGDVNKDGIADIVIGCQDGNFWYYKGLGYQTVGAKKQLNFRLVSDAFGNVYTNDTAQLSNGRDGMSSPLLIDLDKNGKLDLISGSSYGSIYLYMNIQNNLSGTFKEETNFLYSPLQQQYENRSFGRYSHPALALLNNDTLPDLVIGNSKGGLYYYSSHSVILTSATPSEEKITFKLYPNPANGTVHIYAQNGFVSVRIYDMLGQTMQIYHNVHEIPQATFDISFLPKGIYIVQVQNGLGESSIKKLIVE